MIARELNLAETPVSKVMTKNPVFVLSDTLAVEALQKMVQGWPFVMDIHPFMHIFSHILPSTVVLISF